jgi:hypothetical protein
MVIKTAKRIATALTPNKRPRVEKRELLMVAKVNGALFVLIPSQPVILSRGCRTARVVYEQLQPALPLFTTSMNIVHWPNHRWPAHFVHDHVEYDVVEIAFCDVMGLNHGDTPTAALIRCDFRIVPVNEHVLQQDIKRVLPV